MNLFFDDSGAFSWHNPGISLFVGVSIPDRHVAATFATFQKWRRTVIGSSKREVKGGELTENQLRSFVQAVLPRRLRDVWLTVVGADTTTTSHEVISQSRDQLSAQLAIASDQARLWTPPNVGIANTYREMAGWVKNRSAPNFLWVSSLEETVMQTLQHTIIRHLDPKDDREFENIEITIDRSFISRERHVVFWKEWLRNGLLNRSNSKDRLTLPQPWAERDHPFLRKYDWEGLLDLRDLFQEHMSFADSKAIVGLQLADICANICYRHWRGQSGLEAFRFLRPRITRGTITLIQYTKDSLIRDAIENHVKTVDYDAMRKRSRERGAIEKNRRFTN